MSLKEVMAVFPLNTIFLDTLYTIYRCELYTNLLDPGAACWLDTVGWEDRKKEDMESFREDAVTTQTLIITLTLTNSCVFMGL